MICFQVKKRLHGPDGPMVLDVGANFRAGCVTAVLGPSGSGKSTLLRILAGLEKPDEGRVHFGEETWQDCDHFLPPQRRGIGFVFQDFALFPRMTVMKNLMFAARNTTLAEARALLERMGMLALADTHPGSLSGGQKQRVALARTLLSRPRLLLLDEPLSALDWETKPLLTEMLRELKRIRTTLILVSHDPEEVRHLADHAILLQRGRITIEGPAPWVLEQWGEQVRSRMCRDGFRAGKDVFVGLKPSNPTDASAFPFTSPECRRETREMAHQSRRSGWHGD